MDKMPKRRKHQDNPYTLNKDENKGIYLIKFKDSLGITREIAISKELFNTFNEFELQDLSELNEYDNHIEHSQIYENNLNNRAIHKSLNIEDDFIKKSSFEDLKNAIELLPETQKRRIKKYYFEEKNEYQIAKEEHTRQQSIHESLIRAKHNLKNILKNYKNF